MCDNSKTVQSTLVDIIPLLRIFAFDNGGKSESSGGISSREGPCPLRQDIHFFQILLHVYQSCVLLAVGRIDDKLAEIYNLRQLDM